MKLKLDENLGRRGLELFERAGHDVETVASEGISSSPDQDLIQKCRRERRCLVTLDLDFGNPLLFKPSEFEGIVVLRLPPKPAHTDLLAAVETLIRALENQIVTGKLWIVQRRRVREYQEEAPE